jgi:hypothetical protein
VHAYSHALIDLDEKEGQMAHGIKTIDDATEALLVDYAKLIEWARVMAD